MTAIYQMVPASQISEQGISPQFVLELLLSAKSDPESRGFVALLVKQSLETPLATVKEYMGDSKRLDSGTIGEPFFQPPYIEMLSTALAHSLTSAASKGTAGLPRRFYLSATPVFFRPSSWWTWDAPALPLDIFLLRARNMAWYLYWFAEHGDNLDTDDDGSLAQDSASDKPSGFNLS